MSAEHTRFLLIRHGANDFLTQRRLAGWLPGVHLNELGRAQAQATGQRLAAAPLAAIYSSPLERCRETAEAIAAPHGLAVQVLDEIGEARCGDWTGQLISELQGTEMWRTIQSAPSLARFPGGESFYETQARMVAAFERLRVAHAGQLIAVVSHSDPLKLALAYYIGQHLDQFQRLVIQPAAISELVFSPAGPRLLRCNDCAHLPEEKPS
jgi:probable phosphoglycerate mutase